MPELVRRPARRLVPSPRSPPALAGLLLAVLVTAASAQDRGAARPGRHETYGYWP